MQVRILSIDGGGAKGIIPAVILEYIEVKLQELAKNPKVRLSDFLDFVAGTAAGALITTMIITPDENRKPAYTLKEIVSNFLDFESAYYQKKNWKTLWGWIGPQYSAKNVEELHIKYFNHWKMKDLLLPTAIPGYDIFNRKPVIFTNKDGTDKYEDYFAKDVVRGSGASPAWISPAEFRDGTYKNLIVNGNLIANNPSMIAFVEASKTPQIIDKFKRLSVDNVYLISLGTGQSKFKKYTSDDVRLWNKNSWYDLLLNMGIQSSTVIPEYEIRIRFESHGCPNNYVRIDPEIRLGSSNRKDTSKKNMLHLLQDANNYIAANHSFLDEVALTLFNQDERYSTMLF